MWNKVKIFGGGQGWWMRDGDYSERGLIMKKSGADH